MAALTDLDKMLAKVLCIISENALKEGGRPALKKLLESAFVNQSVTVLVGSRRLQLKGRALSEYKNGQRKKRCHLTKRKKGTTTLEQRSKASNNVF